MRSSISCAALRPKASSKIWSATASPVVRSQPARATSTGLQPKPGVSLSPEHLWWLHTAGAARALDLEGVIGNLQPGCEADFVVLNPEATPLLARRTRAAGSLAELLFALIVLGDDRVVERTVIAAPQQGAPSLRPA